MCGWRVPLPSPAAGVFFLSSYSLTGCSGCWPWLRKAPGSRYPPSGWPPYRWKTAACKARGGWRQSPKRKGGPRNRKRGLRARPGCFDPDPRQAAGRHTVGKRRRVKQEAVGARVRNEKVARGIESEACGHGQGVSIQYSRRPIGYRETRLADDEGGGRIRGARSERRGGILQHAAVTGIHHEQIAGAVHG